MERLRQFIDGLVAGFVLLVDALSPMVAALASGIFDVEITAAAARGFTTALLLLICAWGISKAYYGVTKSPANQPMKVEHFTSKTPAQVVSEDRWGKFKALVAVGAVLVIVYFFGTAAMR